MARVSGFSLVICCASPLLAVWGDERESEAHQRWAHVADAQIRLLTETLELNPQQQSWLRAEYDRRLAQMPEFDRISADLGKVLREAKSAADRSDGLRRLVELNRNQPLSIDDVLRVLTPQLSAEQKNGGLDRLAKRRSSATNHQPLANPADDISKRYALRETVGVPPPPQVSPPTLSPGVLAGKAGQKSTNAAPPSAPRLQAASSEHRPMAPVVRQPSRPTATGILVVQPSEWAKLVRDSANEHRLGDAQISTAQAILRDCERRANVYRTVHAADYARVATVTDSKSRQDQQKALDAPIAAIGVELRERLEQIPTAAQRTGHVMPAKRK